MTFCFRKKQLPNTARQLCVTGTKHFPKYMVFKRPTFTLANKNMFFFLSFHLEIWMKVSCSKCQISHLLSAHNWFYLSARQQGTVSFYWSYNKKPMQGFSMCKENKNTPKALYIIAHVRNGVRIAGSVPSCAAGLMVPPADSLWETMVTLILALLEALLGVGLGVCLLLPCDLSSSLSRPSIWSLVTGTAPRKQKKQGQTQAWTHIHQTAEVTLFSVLSSCDLWIQILNLKAHFYCLSS